MGEIRHPPHQTATTPDIHHTMCKIGHPPQSVEYVCWYWIYHANNWGMNVSWRVSVCPLGTGLGNVHFWKMYIVVWWMSGVVDVRCGGCPVWWMSGVVDVWCGGCLVWWMSYFTHGVVDVWCGGCLVWWMSFFTYGVMDVWCGGCPILPMVWWMSGVVDVCVVDVVQSLLQCSS